MISFVALTALAIIAALATAWFACQFLTWLAFRMLNLAFRIFSFFLQIMLGGLFILAIALFLIS